MYALWPWLSSLYARNGPSSIRGGESPTRRVGPTPTISRTHVACFFGGAGAVCREKCEFLRVGVLSVSAFVPVIFLFAISRSDCALCCKCVCVVCVGGYEDNGEDCWAMWVKVRC